MRIVFAVVVGLVAALAGATAQADPAGDVERGHAFARAVCALCHAVEAGTAASPHPSAPSFERIAAEPGMTATALTVILRNPHREMPDLVIAPADLADVIAYILSLAGRPHSSPGSDPTALE